MNKKIPCEVIRDLFPSYIDELTSPVTDRVIEEHLQECGECREALAAMRAPSASEKMAETDKKEIDFLKKNKKKNRRILLSSIAGALVFVLVCLAGSAFLVGRGGFTAWAPMRLEVEGRKLSFDAVPYDSASAVSKLTYKEEKGTVTIDARSVLASPLHPGSLAGTYEAGEEIREVRVGGRIVWADGATVSALASDLFEERHSYVGDMPANGRLTQALGLAAFLGPFTNELETEKEPYGWRILLSREISPEALAQKEQDMNAFGMILTGLVGNLDRVTFVYTCKGEEREKTIASADASALLGEDVKTCMEDVRALDSLIRKTGLSLYAIPGRPETSREEMIIKVRNMTDQVLESYGSSFYKDGVLISSGGGMNADGSGTGAGEIFWIPVSPMEFGGVLEADSLLEAEFSFRTADGQEIKVEERVRIGYEGGTSCEMVLTGNAADGYRIGE